MKREKSKKQRRRRALKMRRRAAVVALLLALGAAGLSWSAGPGLSMVLWGAAAVILAVEAALLARRRALPAAVYALLCVLCAALLAGGFRVRGYVFSDSGIVPVESTVSELRITDSWPENLERYTSLKSLDMRGSTVSDFSPALTLRGLERMDVRGNYRFTEADLEATHAALPRCEVKWSIPISGNYYDSDVQDIDVTSLGLSAGEIAALQAQYPDKRFHTAAINAMGLEIDPQAEALDLRSVADIDPQAVLDVLALMPNVKEVDLRGTPLSAEAIGALNAAFPQARFLCTCDAPAPNMTTEDAVVTLPGGTFEDLQACMAFIDYMPALEYIDARSVALGDSELQALQADPRAEKVVYTFALYGRQVSSLDIELNLDGVALSGADEVEAILQRLPRLQRLSLCDCGLSDQDMDRLFNAHPDVKLIWWVTFGRYRLRTDATAFTTNLYANNTYHYDSATFAPLRYCTDLLMLDLGHCDITTVEGLSGLKKLRVLILADNDITDISPLAGLEDLEYVELFLNKITDFSPLANKSKLLDLNIYYCPIADVTPLTTCAALQRLWLGQCGLSDAQIKVVKSALPDCKVNAKGSSSTGQGWRDHRRYQVIRQMYKQGSYIPFS